MSNILSEQMREMDIPTMRYRMVWRLAQRGDNIGAADMSISSCAEVAEAFWDEFMDDENNPPRGRRK